MQDRSKNSYRSSSYKKEDMNKTISDSNNNSPLLCQMQSNNTSSNNNDASRLSQMQSNNTSSYNNNASRLS